MQGSPKRVAFNVDVCLFRVCERTSSSCSLVIFQGVDMFFKKFKGREEDGVDGTRAAHRHAQASVHVQFEELDLYWRNRLAARIHQAVALVYTLGRVNRVCGTLSEGVYRRRGGSQSLTDHGPRNDSAQTTCHKDSNWIRWCTVSAKVCQELLAALVGHEVDPGAERVSHCD